MTLNFQSHISTVQTFANLFLSNFPKSNYNGFTNIPKSIYWTIVTLTTVGFGDIIPQTPFGQFIASIIMILGYAIIAIPTGIVSSEMTKKNQIIAENTEVCPNCAAEHHKENAKHCYQCGSNLHA
jgi:voltage-gated potassium channel